MRRSSKFQFPNPRQFSMVKFQKSKSDTHALPKSGSWRTKQEKALPCFARECFRSAMRPRIALATKACTEKERGVRNFYVRELAARAAALLYAQRHLHHYRGNVESKTTLQ